MLSHKLAMVTKARVIVETSELLDSIVSFS